MTSDDLKYLYKIIYKFKTSISPIRKNRLFKKILEFFNGDIYYISKKYSQYSQIDFDDMRQDLSLSLYNLIMNYNIKDTQKFKGFRSYVLTAFHNKACEIYNKLKKKKVIPYNKIVSLQSTININESDIQLCDIIEDKTDFFKIISDKDFIEKLKLELEKKYHIILDKMLLGIYDRKELGENIKNNKGKKMSKMYVNKVFNRKIIPAVAKLLLK